MVAYWWHCCTHFSYTLKIVYMCLVYVLNKHVSVMVARTYVKASSLSRILHIFSDLFNSSRSVVSKAIIVDYVAGG